MANKMPNQVKVNIIQDDLEMASRGDKNDCPIYWAIVRAYPNLVRVDVTEAHVSVTDPVARERYSWDTPPSAVDWIRQFDGGGDVGPLKFVLHKADSVIKPMHNRTAEERAAARRKNAEFQQKLSQESKEQAAERKQRNQERRARQRRGVA